jgi:hypothetical protein
VFPERGQEDKTVNNIRIYHTHQEKEDKTGPEGGGIMKKAWGRDKSHIVKNSFFKYSGKPEP